MQFIKDVTGIAVKDVIFPKRDLDLNIGIVDILCKDQSGDQYLIEIEIEKYQTAFKKRMLYYGAKLFSSQLEPGDPQSYGRTLRDVVIIGITNYSGLKMNCRS